MHPLSIQNAVCSGKLDMVWHLRFSWQFIPPPPVPAQNVRANWQRPNNLITNQAATCHQTTCTVTTPCHTPPAVMKPFLSDLAPKQSGTETPWSRKPPRICVAVPLGRPPSLSQCIILVLQQKPHKPQDTGSNPIISTTLSLIKTDSRGGV